MTHGRTMDLCVSLPPLWCKGPCIGWMEAPTLSVWALAGRCFLVDMVDPFRMTDFDELVTPLHELEEDDNLPFWNRGGRQASGELDGCSG